MKNFKCKNLSTSCHSKHRLVWFESFPEGEVVKTAPSLTFSDLKTLRIEADNVDLNDAQRKDADAKLREFYQKAHDSKDANALKEWRTFKKWDDARYWQKERATFSTALKSPEAQQVEANLHVNGRYTLVEDTNIFDGRGRPRGILFARDNVLIPLSKTVITINGAEYIKVKIDEEGKPFSALRRGLVLKSSIGGLSAVKMSVPAQAEVAKPEAVVTPEVVSTPEVAPVSDFDKMNALSTKLKSHLQLANTLNADCAACLNKIIDEAKKLTYFDKAGKYVDSVARAEKHYAKAKSDFEKLKAAYAKSDKLNDEMVAMYLKIHKQEPYASGAKLKTLVSDMGDYLEALARVNMDKDETEKLFSVADEVIDGMKLQ